MCGADCGVDGPCVGYALETNIPVPLEGLKAASETLRTFTVRESIDLIDRNGDADKLDTVAVLRDRTTGQTQPLGAPSGCAISGTPEGRPISQRSASASRRWRSRRRLAFPESESTRTVASRTAMMTRRCHPAHFRLAGRRRSRRSAGRGARTTTAVCRVHGRVFVRSSEAAMAMRLTERSSGGPMGVPPNGGSASPFFSADGRYVGFTSNATNLLSPGVDTNGQPDAFVYDRQTGTTERVSVGPGGVQGDNVSGGTILSVTAGSRCSRAGPTICRPGNDTNGVFDVRPRPPDRHTERVSAGLGGAREPGFAAGGTSADGRYVAFNSIATNLLGPGQTRTGAPMRPTTTGRRTTERRVNVGPGGR
jgi:hypothetical protein